MLWLILGLSCSPLAAGHSLHEYLSSRDGLGHGGLQMQQDFQYGFDEHNGPNVWDQYFPTCGGPNQSPIALGRPDRVAYQPKGLNNYNIPRMMTLSNCGKGYIEYCIYENKSIPIPDSEFISLDNKFNLFSIHLHWGSDNSKGSPHSIDGKHFPNEVTHGFYNKKYRSPMEAYLNYPRDPNAVMENSLFYKVGKYNDDPGFNKILEDFRLLNGTENGLPVYHIDEFPSWSVFRESDYYQYEGSVMHPPCVNSLQNVFTTPLEMSEGQMNLLRSIVKPSGEHFFNSARPIQPLDQRKVTLVKRDPPGHIGSKFDSHSMDYDGYNADSGYPARKFDRRPMDYVRHADYSMDYGLKDRKFDRRQIDYDRHVDYSMDYDLGARKFGRRPMDYDRHDDYSMDYSRRERKFDRRPVDNDYHSMDWEQDREDYGRNSLKYDREYYHHGRYYDGPSSRPGSSRAGGGY